MPPRLIRPELYVDFWETVDVEYTILARWEKDSRRWTGWLSHVSGSTLVGMKYRTVQNGYARGVRDRNGISMTGGYLPRSSAMPHVSPTISEFVVKPEHVHVWHQDSVKEQMCKIVELDRSLRRLPQEQNVQVGAVVPE